MHPILGSTSKYRPAEPEVYDSGRSKRRSGSLTRPRVQVATEVPASARGSSAERWFSLLLVPDVVSDHRFVAPDRQCGIPERPETLTNEFRRFSRRRVSGKTCRFSR